MEGPQQRRIDPGVADDDVCAPDQPRDVGGTRRETTHDDVRSELSGDGQQANLAQQLFAHESGERPTARRQGRVRDVVLVEEVRGHLLRTRRDERFVAQVFQFPDYVLEEVDLRGVIDVEEHAERLRLPGGVRPGSWLANLLH